MNLIFLPLLAPQGALDKTSKGQFRDIDTFLDLNFLLTVQTFILLFPGLNIKSLY